MKTTAQAVATLLLATVLPASEMQNSGGVIAGVVAYPNGERAAGAHVALADRDGVPVRGVLTTSDGSFRFDGVPEGTYLLGARKAGYPDVVLGQMRPSGPGALIPIRNGQVREIPLTLVPGGVISGIVSDHRGPLAGAFVSVFAAEPDGPSARRGSRTNSRGEYRIWGLRPGRYFIAASRGGDDGAITVIDDRGEQSVRFLSPRFHPAALGTNHARPVEVEAGQQVSGIDISLAPAPAGRIEGSVEGLHPGLRPGSVRLLPTWGDPRSSLSISASVAADGRFSFDAVPPGLHTVVFQTLSAEAPQKMHEAVPHWGIATVPVAADQLATVTVPVMSGATIGGRLVFDGDVAPDPKQAWIQVETIAGPFKKFPRGGYGESRNGVEFSVAGVAPGTFQAIARAPAGWWTLAVLSGDTDVLDFPREAGAGDAVTDLRVVVTNRITGIAGTVRPANRRPAFEQEVVIFPVDRRYWLPEARRIRIVQPDIDGRFEGLELPPGDYAVAVNADARIDPIRNPDVLSGLLPRAVRTSLRLGEKANVDLTAR